MHTALMSYFKILVEAVFVIRQNFLKGNKNVLLIFNFKEHIFY